MFLKNRVSKTSLHEQRAPWERLLVQKSSESAYFITKWQINKLRTNTLRLGSAALALLNTHGEWILLSLPTFKLFTSRQRPRVNFIFVITALRLSQWFFFVLKTNEKKKTETNSDSKLCPWLESHSSEDRGEYSCHVMPLRCETALMKERDALRNWMQNALGKTWPEYSKLARRQCLTANTAGDRLVIPDTLKIDSKETHTPHVISCMIKLELIMKSV